MGLFASLILGAALGAAGMWAYVRSRPEAESTSVSAVAAKAEQTGEAVEAMKPEEAAQSPVAE